jgi:hypothetical protein
LIILLLRVVVLEARLLYLGLTELVAVAQAVFLLEQIFLLRQVLHMP